MTPLNFRSDQYPRFYHYLTKQMPEVANVPKIARAMQTWGKMNLSTFRDALKPGRPPYVFLWADLYDDSGKKVNGYTPPTPPVPLVKSFLLLPPTNSILIERRLVNDFESGSPDALVNTTEGDPANNRRVYKVGIVTLHELAHWGDWKAKGKFEPVIEVGEEFESEVYGGIL